MQSSRGAEPGMVGTGRSGASAVLIRGVWQSRGQKGNGGACGIRMLLRHLPPQRAGGRSSGVEHDLAKVGVEGSNPFARSSRFPNLIFFLSPCALQRGVRGIRAASAYGAAGAVQEVQTLRGLAALGYRASVR